MGITVTEIKSLLGRYTNKVVNEQANLACPFIGNEYIKKRKISNAAGVVNVKAGEVQSAGVVQDLGTLPVGASVSLFQGTYLPQGVFARLEIPRIAAKTATSRADGVNLVKEQMESAGATLGRILARCLFNPSLGQPVAQVNSGSTTFQLNSTAGIRVGMWLEVWNGNTLVEGAANTGLQVTAVDPSIDGTPGTVTFTGTGSGSGNASTWLTTYSFYIRGSRSTAGTNGYITSFADICSTGDLYGITASSSNEWAGNADTTTTTMTVRSLRNVLQKLKKRRGKKASHIVVNSTNAERYSELLLNNRRFANKDKMDAVGDAGFELDGIPWVEDENVDDTDVFFFQKDDVFLHEFQDFQPEIDGDASAGMGPNAFIVSPTALSYDVQVLGLYNVRAERRNGMARMSAIAA